MKDNNQKTIDYNIYNNKNGDLTKINILKINGDKNNKKYNKVIKALLDNDNNNENINIGDNEFIQNQNNKEDFYKYNFEKSENIDSLNNLLLIKSSIRQENIEPKNKYQSRIININNNGNKKFKIKYDNNNLIESKEEEKENENNEKKENKNDKLKVEENNNKKEKGELDLTYNFDNDVFNVTQQQMDIMDGEVNKIYNNYKNKMEIKNFKINHPHLEYKNKYDNNYDYIDTHITKEERQKRLFPILEKQKLILEKIKKNNISRSNILSIDSDSKTKDKIKSNKYSHSYKLNQINNNIKGNIFNNNINKISNDIIPSYNNNSIETNNDINNNILYNNYKNNNILRYQNLYNNGPLSSDNRTNISSNYKKNNEKRKVIYEPYTLIEYKKKYENNRNRKLLGGLGANIGGEDWINRQKILERKRQYSEYVKNDNEEDIKRHNKIRLKLKSVNYETVKTVSSQKSSEFSNDKLSKPFNNKYHVIKTENNINKNNQIKLPLIKEKNSYSKNINKKGISLTSKKKYKIKENNEINFISNPIGDINGNEKDLKELIRQYEEYNGKF